MSEIILHPHGAVSFYGPDAVEYFRVHQLKSALHMYAKTGLIPTRGMGITRMLTLASQVTGNKYKRTQILNAIDDLHIWLSHACVSLPVSKAK